MCSQLSAMSSIDMVGVFDLFPMIRLHVALTDCDHQQECRARSLLSGGMWGAPPFPSHFPAEQRASDAQPSERGC
jgi:hypothetical protein